MAKYKVKDTRDKTVFWKEQKKNPVKKPGYAGGGISSHGLGRAFMKGGKV